MPPTIVWIALAESEMISGWWGEAEMDARPGGQFRILLLVTGGTVCVTGRVARLEEPGLVELSTDVLGTVRFLLEEAPGGTRGSSTLLTVELDSYPMSFRGNAAPPAVVVAQWEEHIDDLVALLYGRPVDWESWKRRHSAGG
jgi:uncharacterized protein YndB with AHSA1/START domain